MIKQTNLPYIFEQCGQVQSAEFIVGARIQLVRRQEGCIRTDSRQPPLSESSPPLPASLLAR